MSIFKNKHFKIILINKNEHFLNEHFLKKSQGSPNYYTTDHGGSVYSKVETNQLFCRANLSGSFRFHSDYIEFLFKAPQNE